MIFIIRNFEQYFSGVIAKLRFICKLLVFIDSNIIYNFQYSDQLLLLLN